jgi:ABC-type nickel/cobalt efflux system permease component RcnA
VALVLGGVGVLRAGLGAAAQAATIQAANAALILLVGLWLSWRAARPPADRAPADRTRRGAWLAGTLTGLAPCPLTTFVMSYAVQNAVVAAGLATVAAMAAGMLATIAGVVLAAIAVRARVLDALERTKRWRRGAGRALEAAGALAIVAIGAFGLWRALAAP